jgi:hypothetical protein
MSTDTISPLRHRMIEEDMNARKLCAGTQSGHIRSCKRFAAFLKRSPDTATAEDIRRFELHLSETGTRICNRNRIMTGLRFLFRVTLRRLDLAAEIYHIREPQKIPLVMSPDENAAPAGRRTALAAAPMPVLRRPHDRHRDLCARMRAQAPAFAASRGNQDRHLMMLSPLIDGGPDTRFSCWFIAGSDGAHISSLDWSATPPSIGSAYGRATRFHPRKPGSFELKRARRPQSSNLSKPKPAAKSP